MALSDGMIELPLGPPSWRRLRKLLRYYRDVPVPETVRVFCDEFANFGSRYDGPVRVVGPSGLLIDMACGLDQRIAAIQSTDAFDSTERIRRATLALGGMLTDSEWAQWVATNKPPEAGDSEAQDRKEKMAVNQPDQRLPKSYFSTGTPGRIPDSPVSNLVYIPVDAELRGSFKVLRDCLCQYETNPPVNELSDEDLLSAIVTSGLVLWSPMGTNLALDFIRVCHFLREYAERIEHKVFVQQNLIDTATQKRVYGIDQFRTAIHPLKRFLTEHPEGAPTGKPSRGKGGRASSSKRSKNRRIRRFGK